MIKQITIVIDDHKWPNLRVQVNNEVRECAYDIADTNLQPMITNAFSRAMREVVAYNRSGARADDEKAAAATPVIMPDKVRNKRIVQRKKGSRR